MEEQRTRKRGVRASRPKLNRALAEAGLKTQNALAERLADLEGLDNVPKDLVNRVFREQPVEPLSLERVARALGVEAHTLYLTGAESSSQAPPEAQAPPESAPVLPPAAAAGGPAVDRRRIVTPWRAAAGVLAVLVLAAVAVWNLPADSELGCRMREFVQTPKVADGRLGIVVARFADDSANMAQYFLATNFIDDARMGPYVSVLTTCRTLSLEGSGDLGARRAAVRAEGRKLLERSGARVLIWGRAVANRLLVRFVSTRQGTAAVTVDIGGRPVAVEESQLQIPLSMNRSAGSLPDIKKAAFELMKLENPAEAELRRQAMRSYRTSIDWLRAAIVSGENLRQSIDPELDPRRWAAVNGDLCYDYRLLGDYDEEARLFHAAEEACNEVIKVSPQPQFPVQWASASINLASAYVRLNRFATSTRDSIALLRQAEEALLAVANVVQHDRTPQQWALVQRNLGIVYVRLGELTKGRESEDYFDRAVSLTTASLALQQPAFQPLDWAITEQNLCLALHESGARRGAAGIDLVTEAVGHCREALHWLSPDDSPLDWAMAQNNLAIGEAMLSLMRNDKASLTAAIDAFKKSQTVYTRESLPEKWAEIETNLGELYCHLAQIGGDSAAFEPAIAHSNQALEVFIEKNVARYQGYAERQLTAIVACQAAAPAGCGCSGSG